MSAQERQQAESAVKAYTMAAAKAKIAADRGMSFEVKGEKGQPSFSVAASEIRDELFDRPVRGEFNKEEAGALADNLAPWPIRVYANGLRQSLPALTKTFIHEGIHRSGAEGAAYDGAPVVTNPNHKAGYDRAAEKLYNFTPNVGIGPVRWRQQNRKRSGWGIISIPWD